MEAAPAAAFEVAQTNFLFELLIVALDAPAQFRHPDHGGKADVRWQRRKPIFGRLLFAPGPFDQQPLLGPRLAALVIEMRGTNPQPGEARPELASVPCRQLIVRHALFGRLSAKSLTETG